MSLGDSLLRLRGASSASQPNLSSASQTKSTSAGGGVCSWSAPCQGGGFACLVPLEELAPAGAGCVPCSAHAGRVTLAVFWAAPERFAPSCSACYELWHYEQLS